MGTTGLCEEPSAPSQGGETGSNPVGGATRTTCSEALGKCRRYVAAELLDLAERNGPLMELQATVLVPLELDLIARPGVASSTPGRWVETVTAALPSQGQRRHGSRRTIPPG